MKIKYVFFDCWDTVLQIDKDHPNGDLSILYRHIINKGKYTLDELYSDYADFCIRYYKEATYDIKDDAAMAYIIESKNHFLDCSYKHACQEIAIVYKANLVDGVKPFVSFLKSKNMGCSVLSNSVQPQDIVIKTIKKAWKNQPFDIILGSSNYGIKKPDSRFFLLGATKMHVNPSDCLFIGDNFFTDIRGAYAANMHPVWLNCKQKLAPQELMKDISYSEVKSYEELKDLLLEGNTYEL